MDKKLMRVKEVADYLSVSKGTIYSWIKKGELKATRIGKTLFISLKMINDLFKKYEK
jgi:excisionase family DNA binding protein